MCLFANDIVPKNKNLVGCLSDDINFETWEKLAGMGMLKLLFYMAIQNKIKATDHARDKFSNVYVLYKDHLNGFIQQVHLWLLCNTFVLIYAKYYHLNETQILVMEKFSKH